MARLKELSLHLFSALADFIKKGFSLSTTLLQILTITLVLWLAIDRWAERFLPAPIDRVINTPAEIIRAPAPYIEFKGAGFQGDQDAYGYRWLPKDIDPDALHISFFGGSTGYQGNPPIAITLEKELSQMLGRKVQVANFSVMSSNHRQHLHNIIESRSLFTPDIVIFYGGYNETVLGAAYDPRPGYPFNTFYTRETSDWAKLLLHTTTFFVLDKKGIVRISPLAELQERWQPFSAQWQAQVQYKYFETLALARTVSSAFDSAKCGGKAKFVFFYQPYQVPGNFKATHEAIRRQVATLDYGYDVSDSFDKLDHPYFDSVHVTQEADGLMAKRMASILLQSSQLRDCFIPAGAHTLAPIRLWPRNLFLSFP